jgi:hypothetical protein
MDTTAFIPGPAGLRLGSARAVVIVAVAALLSALAAVGSANGAAAAAPPPPASVGVRTVTDAAATTARGAGAASIDLVPGSVLGQRPRAVRGAGEFDFATGEGRVTLRGSAGAEQVLFLPRAMFVRQPPPASGASPLPAGKSWVSAGLNEKQGTGSGLPQFVDQVEVVNAGLVLNEIRWGAIAAKPIGTKQVGARSARGFVVTVDLRRAQATGAGLGGPTFAQVVGYQAGALTAKSTSTAAVRVDVWVSDAGRVVRVQWSPPGGGVGTTSITLSALHRAFHFNPPPSSQTVDVAILGPAGEQEGGLGDIA